jgi:hypothetical protein
MELIYSYAAAVERWPELLPHYRRVDILEEDAQTRLVSMQCVRNFGPLHWPCKWRARQELLPEEGRILFSHVSGPARGMKVEWLLERMPEGIRTTIRHWQSSDSFYWNRIVAPIFIRSIANQTLVGIKRIVEGEIKQ